MTKILATTITGLLITSLILSNTSWALADDDVKQFDTRTPIRHVVVIFDENISFDHYFGTYPYAKNPPGEPRFEASNGTPTVNGLTQDLLDNNPNLKNPFRLDRSQTVTCKSNNGYGPEQLAYDAGLVDKFVQEVGGTGKGCNPDGSSVMGFVDGNTVTALWNYAQHFSMSDNFYGTTFGASGIGEWNLVSGNTHGLTPYNMPGVIVNGTAVDDVDPTFDDCSQAPTENFLDNTTNVGDLLNKKGITWGWFQGGFKPTVPWNPNTNMPAQCGSWHLNISGDNVTDYDPSHEAFQYYKSTANPHHLPPTSVSMIGKTDQANHQYDLSDFWKAADSGNMPAVNFLKPLEYQNGHGGISDPLDEQTWLVTTMNHLQRLPEWKDTAVFITYDDSGGWYDHVMPPIISQSNDPANDFGCGTAKLGAFEDRCGHGPRLPLLVISPYAKQNFVDNTMTDQTSILKFIENNWDLGRIGNQSFDVQADSLSNMFDFKHGNTNKLFLDTITGEQQ